MALHLAFWQKWLVVCILIPVGLLGVTENCFANEAGSRSVSSQLRQIIEPFSVEGSSASALLEVEALQLPLHEQLVSFYRQRDYHPAWFQGGTVAPVAWQWLERVQGVAAEGLNPRDYHVETLAVSLEMAHIAQSYGVECDSVGLALIDILLTDAFLKYVSHLLGGRVDITRLYAAEWQAVVPKTDAVTVLHQVLLKQQVGAVLEELVPYRASQLRLGVYLEHYRQLALAGGWPLLPVGPSVSLGKRDHRVPLLRHFLMLVGDLDKSRESSSWTLDRPAVEALKRFQARHGLRADGVLGKDTLAQINVPVARRIEQLRLNLERERWPAQDTGPRYLQVDITDFNLTVVDQGVEVMRMPVVVGTEFRRTPVFSALMKYLVFAPYWTVPPTIFQEDKWPHIKADRNYLTAHHYEIVAWGKAPNRIIDPASLNWKTLTAQNFPGMLRQKPGPWNPLGKVKFMFPNAYHVYLHDTPSQHLFGEQQRTFSSGCIRIARPLELAVYLLEGQAGWDRERIEKEMAGSKPYSVRLKRPVPVHILYRTAWVDAQGRLQFRNDIYQRDAKLQAVLQDQSMPEDQPTEMASQGGVDIYDAESESGVHVIR
ncbi:MAG: murein L,D-transpeptidase [Pedobacter sp.]